jgi:hypothetical protein
MSTSATRHQNFRCEFETVKNARADSPARLCRLLQVADARHDHCRPQTSIATLLRRFSVTSLAHRAHSTSHHNVRQSQHQRSLVERALVKRVVGPVRARESCRAVFENFDGRWTLGSGDGFTTGLRRRGAADFETTHSPWLPFHPLAECSRHLVFHDHDAQDAIFPQERSGANSGGLDGGIRSPRGGKIGRGASPHRRDESEHDVDGRASTVVPPGGAGGTASGARSTSRGCVNGGSCLESACSS